MTARIAAETVAKIKSAAMDGHSVRAVASHYGVGRATVEDIWKGRYRANVKPAAEPDRIEPLRVPPVVVRYEGRTLRSLGLTDRQIAARLGVSISTVQRYL